MASYGVLGRSLSHSLSPQLHGLIYENTGYQADYRVLEMEPEEIPGLLSLMRREGLSGLNVTIPYKQAVIPLLDELSPEAAEIGAVNTIWLRQDGKAVGYNTDYYGFSSSLSHAGVEVKGKKVVMCGMSGAGRAVFCALRDKGAEEITVASTDRAKGISYQELKEREGADIIVNCTPVGMYPDTGKSVVGSQVLSRYRAAVDIVYNPLETLFLQKAEKLGLKTVNGLYMLIFQGMKSFSIWTGMEPPTLVADAIFHKLKTRFL